MHQSNAAPNLTVFYSAELAAQIQKLNVLAERFPILIPIPTCCKFMQMSDEGLRRAILQKQIAGTFWWRKAEKQNYAYRIQTLPFYLWYAGNLFSLPRAAQQTRCYVKEDSNRALEKTSAVQKRIASLHQLIAEHPVSIPVTACASFMGVSEEGLRRAIQLENIPGALCWKQAGKAYRGYSIQAVPFAIWQLGKQAAVQPTKISDESRYFPCRKVSFKDNGKFYEASAGPEDFKNFLPP